jgi:hypothetical protein
MKEIQSTSLDEIVTPERLLEMHPDKFTGPQLIWMLRRRKMNGLQKAGAVSLVSRRFYINLPKFTAWLISQNH